MKNRTDYEQFELSSAANRRLLRQEELILSVSSALWVALEESGLTRAAVAKKLGRTPGFVSQVLSGGRNLTLRTLSDLTDALGSEVVFRIEKRPLDSLKLPSEGMTIGGWGSWCQRSPTKIKAGAVEASPWKGKVAA